MGVGSNYRADVKLDLRKRNIPTEDKPEMLQDEIGALVEVAVKALICGSEKERMLAFMQLRERYPRCTNQSIKRL